MDLMKCLNYQLTYSYNSYSYNSYSYLKPFKTLQRNKKPTLISISLTRNPLLLHRPTHPLRRPPPEKPADTATTPSDILRLMDSLDIPVPIDIYTSLIRECTETKDPDGAREVCRRVIGSGLDPGLVFVNRALLMLVSCGLMDDASNLFDEMKTRDLNTWAIMVGGYMGSAKYEEAIRLFLEMDFKPILDDGDGLGLKIPFSWVLVCVLKACVETENLDVGKQVHCLVMKFGYEKDLFLSSSLMNLYGIFGCVEGLDCVFNHLGNRNTAIWTSKLVNNCREERFKEAIDVFREMGREGVKKNEFTFSSVLRACSRVEDDGLCGQQVHANLIKLGFDSNGFVQCGLVDMYAKCGLIEYAERVFHKIGNGRTLACWNAMVTGYIQHGYGVDAMKVLYAMKSVGLHPQESLINEVKFTCGSQEIAGEVEPFISDLSARSFPFRKETRSKMRTLEFSKESIII